MTSYQIKNRSLQNKKSECPLCRADHADVQKIMFYPDGRTMRSASGKPSYVGYECKTCGHVATAAGNGKDSYDVAHERFMKI